MEAGRNPVLPTPAEGLSWPMSGGDTWTATDLALWLGTGSQAGRTVPHGFPRNNRFRPG